MHPVTWCLPQFVLHQGSSSPAVMGLQLPKLLVAAVVLLNEYSRPPALLELLLFVVAAKFTLDKDGGLRHLLIKCILRARTHRHVRTRSMKASPCGFMLEYDQQVTFRAIHVSL